MTIRSTRALAGVAALVFSLGLTTGCPGGSSSAGSASSKQACRDVAKAFGEHLVKKDLRAAYDMTSSPYQKRVSFDDFKAKHEKVLAETKSGDPNQVDTDSGSLPSKEDGEKNYGMAGAEPYSAWRGWVFAELRHMEGGEPKSGYEARLLVVEEKGKLRIAYIELGFIS